MDRKRGNSKCYVSYMRKCYSLIRRQSRLWRLGRSSRAAWIETRTAHYADHDSDLVQASRVGRLSGSHWEVQTVKKSAMVIFPRLSCFNLVAHWSYFSVLPYFRSHGHHRNPSHKHNMCLFTCSHHRLALHAIAIPNAVRIWSFSSNRMRQQYLLNAMINSSTSLPPHLGLLDTVSRVFLL